MALCYPLKSQHLVIQDRPRGWPVDPWTAPIAPSASRSVSPSDDSPPRLAGRSPPLVAGAGCCGDLLVSDAWHPTSLLCCFWRGTHISKQNFDPKIVDIEAYRLYIDIKVDHVPSSIQVFHSRVVASRTQLWSVKLSGWLPVRKDKSVLSVLTCSPLGRFESCKFFHP